MVNDDMARVDRQAVLAEYEAERLRCNNLLERPAGDMRRPTRVFETAPLEADEDAALVEGTGRIRDASAADLGRYAALYAELVRGIRRGCSRALEPAPGTEADEVALIERTQRIRDASAADLGHYAALYAEMLGPHRQEWLADEDEDAALVGGTGRIRAWWGGMQCVTPGPPLGGQWDADARRSEVNYKKAVSRDSTIEEMWAKMEALGIMKD